MSCPSDDNPVPGLYSLMAAVSCSHPPTRGSCSQLPRPSTGGNYVATWGADLCLAWRQPCPSPRLVSCHVFLAGSPLLSCLSVLVCMRYKQVTKSSERGSPILLGPLLGARYWGGGSTRSSRLTGEKLGGPEETHTAIECPAPHPSPPLARCSFFRLGITLARLVLRKQRHKSDPGAETC